MFWKKGKRNGSNLVTLFQTFSMGSHPYRSSLSGIDFTNSETLRDVLSQDKHTRVEGLCSEVVFMEDIVEGNLSPITFDIWFIVKGGGYKVMKMLVVNDKPMSELDIIVMDHLADAPGTVETSVVRFDSSTNTFWEFIYVKGQLEEEGSVWPLHGEVEISELKYRNPERLRKATAFLEERGLLREAAIKRIFANCVLPPWGVWDLDAITMVGSMPVAFEVKHKYPTWDKEYGVNDAQGRLFAYLHGAGMPVIHIILEKPMGRKDLSAIDLMSMPQYIGEARWLYTPLGPEQLSGPVKMAPVGTAIHAGREVPYRPVDEKEFKVLKRLYEKDPDVRSKLLEGLL